MPAEGVPVVDVLAEDDDVGVRDGLVAVELGEEGVGGRATGAALGGEELDEDRECGVAVWACRTEAWQRSRMKRHARRGLRGVSSEHTAVPQEIGRTDARARQTRRNIVRERIGDKEADPLRG